MIIENAFNYLPEILCGSNYAAQDYEAGIVNAVSLAVLQELNARNVPNPLSALTVEKLFDVRGFDRPDGKAQKRYLRSDLFLDTTRMYVATEALGRFGWRHHNWIEAMFFRPDGPASTVNGTTLFADIVRLCCLIPPTVLGWNRMKTVKSGKTTKQVQTRFSPSEGSVSKDGKYSDICVARYLLHVYQDDIDDLLGKKAFPWANKLRSPGPVTIEVKVGDDTRTTFLDGIGRDLSDLHLKVTFTNFVINQLPGSPKYTCVLSRVDSIDVSLDKMSWKEEADRTGVEGAPGDWKKIQAKVGKHLLFKAKGFDSKADDVEPNSNELNQGASGATGDTGSSSPQSGVVGDDTSLGPTGAAQ